MTWTRLSDNSMDRPEFLALSRSARLLHIEALVYCNRHLTDGLIPAAALPRITDANNVPALVDELQGAGLWVWDESRTAYLLDWSDQEAAENVRKRKADNRQRQELYRRRQENHRDDKHDLCVPRYCPIRRRHDLDDHTGCSAAWCRNAVTSTVTDRVGNDPPSRPDPSRPVGTGTGERTGGAVARSANAARDTHPTWSGKGLPPGLAIDDLIGEATGAYDDEETT
ncbi:hypothetical protein FB382_001870 [Nocardioides ginsengisegetis]|uniref:Uncharacterized protein n=1 Tax=Nocardioides ginsengisegetis TaxID=661491 RepID=A0A7W3P9M2_9ACTN|nr:hypothetical protein [Nocardioides ginsengisegetis]MBA8803579.1 hypothetical protein [Nocardioides ginsengisegetis]